MPGPNVPLAMCLASKHNPQYYGAKNWYRAISWFKLLVKKRVVIRGTPKRHGIFVMTFAMRAHNSLWNTPVRGQNNQLLHRVKQVKVLVMILHPKESKALAGFLKGYWKWMFSKDRLAQRWDFSGRLTLFAPACLYSRFWFGLKFQIFLGKTCLGMFTIM